GGGRAGARGGDPRRGPPARPGAGKAGVGGPRRDPARPPRPGGGGRRSGRGGERGGDHVVPPLPGRAAEAVTEGDDLAGPEAPAGAVGPAIGVGPHGPRAEAAIA